MSKTLTLSAWLFLSCCETLIRTQPHLSKILYRLKIQVPSALICKPRVRTWSWIKITTYLSMLMYSAKHSAMCPTRAFDRNGKKIWTCESIEPQTSQVCILMTGLSFPSDLSEYITKWKEKELLLDSHWPSRMDRAKSIKKMILISYQLQIQLLHTKIYFIGNMK